MSRSPSGTWPTRTPSATPCGACDTVVHLAASERDQPHGSIEELNGVATWRLVRAAERAGVEHFVFAERRWARRRTTGRAFFAQRRSPSARWRSRPCARTILRSSLVYAPGDRHLSAAHGSALLPAVPVPGGARPLPADLGRRRRRLRRWPSLDEPGHRQRRHELAGPDTLTHREIVAPRAARGRPLADGWSTCRTGAPAPALRVYEALTGPARPATWDEAEHARPRRWCTAPRDGETRRGARRHCRGARHVGSASAARRGPQVAPTAARPRAGARAAAACPRRAGGRRCWTRDRAARRRRCPGGHVIAGCPVTLKSAV